MGMTAELGDIFGPITLQGHHRNWVSVDEKEEEAVLCLSLASMLTSESFTADL